MSTDRMSKDDKKKQVMRFSRNFSNKHFITVKEIFFFLFWLQIFIDLLVLVDRACRLSPGGDRHTSSNFVQDVRYNCV